ncbi:DUF1214 domain-containing protein [Nocardia neocaledoniensis]|uniref:DUF1214 domain-containing protein n=1 Tax=Nocardia neocaledoniensis TaxID=236511 RepID=UPI002458D081|nr:DUF1214 domain-containing protein [Nocardia neocaledoniensis]
MRTVTRTRVGIAVALVLGLVIGAFLSAVLRSTDVFDPPRRTTTTARDVEHAEQVLFASDRGFPSVRTVLRSRADVTQFAGRFFDEDTADDITETLAARDFAAEALIAFAWGAGCAPGDGAKLTTTGNADYSVRLTGAEIYTVGHAPPPVPGPDGAVDIVLQHEDPRPAVPTGNWLPIPATGDFSLTLRLYAPDERAIDGDWQPPPMTAR